MDVLADVGGRPGLDCRGFCSFCYFKGVKNVRPFGCKHCLPFQKGCDYCTRAIVEGYPGFKPMDMVAMEVAQASMFGTPDKVTISGGGDLSCYPELLKLVNIVGQNEVPIHLGYTSGKGFDKGDEALALVEAGVREVSFTVFSTRPEHRRKYMGDRHPEASLNNLKLFCDDCDVYAAAVLIPDVNDGPELDKTCMDLEEMGIKRLILMRFANTEEQGLILGNAPLLPGVVPHSVEAFKNIVTDINDRYSFRVAGTPLWDPETGAPFALSQHKEHISRIPSLKKSATLITSSVAAPLLSSIIEELGDSVNVLPVKKDVACLITIDDIMQLDLEEVKETVILPGRTLACESELRQVLCRDGVDRLIRRGPDRLTVDGEMSISMSSQEVIDVEIEAFSELIEEINAFGV